MAENTGKSNRAFGGRQAAAAGLTEGAIAADEIVLKERLALTPREAAVLSWLARGKSNRDIGAILGLSPRTGE